MRFGGIVLTVLLVLGACSSDPEPIEPTRSTSPTPTEAAPAMPAQAKEDSPEGAAAFVKHYIDVFNYAARTGDVRELSALSAPSCEGCQSYIKLYEDTYAAGGYFKDSDWKIGAIRMEFDAPESFATTRVRSGGGRFRTSSSTVEKASAPARTRVTFAVGGDGPAKKVTQLALGTAE